MPEINFPDLVIAAFVGVGALVTAVLGAAFKAARAERSNGEGTSAPTILRNTIEANTAATKEHAAATASMAAAIQQNNQKFDKIIQVAEGLGKGFEELAREQRNTTTALQNTHTQFLINMARRRGDD